VQWIIYAWHSAYQLILQRPQASGVRARQALRPAGQTQLGNRKSV
jgi:hypothetical protein